MKKLSLLLLASIYGIASMAQSATSAHPAIAHRIKGAQFLNNLLRQQSASTGAAAKTTVTKQRVIAQSDYGSGTSPLDSFAFKYNTGRGSYFSSDYLGYNWGLGPAYFAFVDLFGYANTSGFPLPKNHAPFVSCDTTRKWTMLPVPPYAFGYYATDVFTYDGNNNLIDYSFTGPVVSGTRYVSTFNSLSNITSTMEMDDVTGSTPPVWDTTYLSLFYYNSANKMVLDSQSTYNSTTHTWIPSYRNTYSYDAANNMTHAEEWQWSPPAGWIREATFDMTYTPANKISTYRYYTYMSSTAIPQYIDSFGYSPGVSYYTYNKHKEYISSSLSGMTIGTKNINAAGLPDTLQGYGFSPTDTVTPDSRSMSVIVYNTYKNPVTTTSYQDAGSSTPTTFYSKTYYYYELYEASGIPSAIAATNDIKVFPNPSSGITNVSFPERLMNATVTIAIAGIDGRVIKNESLVVKNTTESISIADLLPGIYVITANDVSGNLLIREKLIKL